MKSKHSTGILYKLFESLGRAKHPIQNLPFQPAMESKRRAEAEAPSNKEESGKATWSSAITSINPWNKSKDKLAADGVDARKVEPMPPVPADDHLTTPLYGQSFRSYPVGCPVLPVRWFHAVDVSTRRFYPERVLIPE